MSAASDRVGQTFSRWRLDALLGKGGMAAVYAATRLQDGARAALKIMHSELVRDREIRERFLREGEIARSVEHPGCVQIIGDDVSEDDEPYLVMELLNGKTLSQLSKARDGRLPVGWLLHVTARILDVLSALHEVNVVHRDIKPSNLFILNDGNVKLLDFGIAQLREPGRDMTRAGLALGTPAYMPPEQAMSKLDTIDARSDIYALGATLFKLISGQRLHKAASEQEAYVLAATQPAPSLARVAAHVPVPVIAIVDKALQWDQRNRFQSAKAMREHVVAYLWKASEADDKRAAPSATTPASAHDGDALEDEFEISGIEIDLELDDAADADVTVARDDGGAHGLRSVEENATALDVELASEPPAARAAVMGRAAVGAEGTAAEKGAPLPAPFRGAQGSARVAAVRAVAPAGATEELPLEPDHPLAPFFVTLDRLLRTARQYGGAHPETHGRLGAVFQAVHAALATQAEIELHVQPFCFSLVGHEGAKVVAWEPAPPGDLVPYTLSVAGLCEVKIGRGVSDAELRELLGAMMIDANRDAADVATALWEASLPHVQLRLEEELAEADARSLEEMFQQTADLELALQRDLTAVQKLALSLDRADVVEAAADAEMRKRAEEVSDLLALDAPSHDSLVVGMGFSDRELHARHVDVLLDALRDTVEREDPETLGKPIAAHAERLLRMGREGDLFGMYDALLDRGRIAAAQLSATLFSDDVLAHVVRMTSAWREAMDPDRLARVVEGLVQVLASSGPERLSFVVELMAGVRDEQTQSIMVNYLVRVSHGRELELLERMEALDPYLTQQVLQRMIARGGSEVQSLLEAQRNSENSALRCEAIALLAKSPMELTQELIALFGSTDKSVRWAALETFIRHNVRSAGPSLVRLVQDKSFRGRALDEQQKVFEALRAINPDRTERLLCEVVVTHGLRADAALDQTRALALRLLEVWARTPGAIAAAQDASSKRWWNTPELRAVAEQTAQALAARLAGGPSAPNGGSGADGSGADDARAPAGQSLKGDVPS